MSIHPSLGFAHKLFHAPSVEFVVARALRVVPTEIFHLKHIAELLQLLFWQRKAGEGRDLSDHPEPVAHDVLVPEHLEVSVGTMRPCGL